MSPRLPFAAAVLAAALLAGCGDSDGGGADGTPARSAASGTVTEQLFAGSATANLRDPGAGRRGGKLTVLSASDVDFLDPGKTYYVYTIGILALIGLGIAGLFAFALAAPAGVLIARILDRNKKTNLAANIEPE